MTTFFADHFISDLCFVLKPFTLLCIKE